MVITNILKVSDSDQLADSDIWLKTLIPLTNVKLLLNQLQHQHNLTYRLFHITLAGNKVTIAPKHTRGLKQFLAKNSDLNPILLGTLLELISTSKEFYPTQVADIWTHLHKDLLLLKSYRQETAQSKCAEYIQTEISIPATNLPAYPINNVRASLLGTNKLSTVLAKDTTSSQYTRRLTLKSKELLHTMPYLTFLEVQAGFDAIKLELLLTQVKTLVSTISKDTTNLPDLNIRIRKMRRTRKDGLFFKHLNLVVVDPRKVDSIWHELGHWVFEYNHLFNLPKRLSGLADPEEFAIHFAQPLLVM